MQCMAASCKGIDGYIMHSMGHMKGVSIAAYSGSNICLMHSMCTLLLCLLAVVLNHAAIHTIM